MRAVINPTPAATILAVYAKLLEFEASGRLTRREDARPLHGAGVHRPAAVRDHARRSPTTSTSGSALWRVRDAKGGWSEGLYLNDDMLIAWMVFATAKAWGPFNTGSQAEVLRAAGWPSERDARAIRSRPYHLRHTVGMATAEQGIDLSDVGGWLGQTDIRTTRNAYVPILKGRMQRSAEAIEGRLAGWKVARKDGTPEDSIT